MTTRPLIDSVRDVTAALLSWAEQCGLAPSGALAIGGAAKRTEIEGGGRPASGKGHLACRLYFDTLTSTLYVSMSVTAPYVWAAVLGAIIPPDPTEPGTPVRIAEGSSRVQIDGSG